MCAKDLWKMLMSQNLIFFVRMYAPRLKGKGNVNNVNQ